MKLSLAWVGAGLVGVFIGCTATGETGNIEEPEFVEPQEEAGSGSYLPPPSIDPDSGGVSDAGTDAGKKDGAADAGTEAGASSPTPGDVCTTKNQIVSRTCGMCGKQEAICQAGDAGGLAWTDYGSCGGEVGACFAGDTRACGNCGTQTCTATCGWGACTGQPPSHCVPGSVEFTGAGCPTGGLKSRTCGAMCQWEDYLTVCESGPAVNLWATASSSSTFMRTNDGKLYGWGKNTDGQLGNLQETNATKMTPIPSPAGDAVAPQVGGGTTYGFTCGLFGSGSAKCWGYLSSTYGLGDGTNYDSLTGVTPTGFGSNLVGIVSGYGHGCGLFADGNAKCWGYNTYGQLGNNNTTTQKTPVAVVGLSGISQLYAGYYTVCARRDDEAWCWGYNNYGQIGDGTTANKLTPTPVIESGVASLAPGYYHTCAVMTDSTLMCWGYNTYGHLGNNTTTNSSVPIVVKGIEGVGDLSNVAEACTGYGHSCARLTDGRVACWGYNNYGQLGIGSSTNSSVAKVVSGITNATKLVCGYYHTCAIDNGYVKCWGYNNYGQLGDGTTSNKSTPQLAKFL